jgi:hypothetical protein
MQTRSHQETAARVLDQQLFQRLSAHHPTPGSPSVAANFPTANHGSFQMLLNSSLDSSQVATGYLRNATSLPRGGKN